MFTIFVSVASIFRARTVTIDNSIFGLHYRATFGLLILCSLVIMSFQYIGDPIDCLVDSKSLDDFMDTWCWIHGTYNVRKCVDKGKDLVQVEVLDSKIKYYKFYQWIGIILFIQALLFYTPHYLWKMWESGHIKMLKGNLDDPLLEEETKNYEKTLVVNYLQNNLGNYNLYFTIFSICEFLNLVNVISQIFLMDAVLDFSFSTFGADILKYLSKSNSISYDRELSVLPGFAKPCNETVNPLEFAFPTMSKCGFSKYGPSGNIIPHDGLCVLPLNSFNQKVYAFLWFWYTILSCVTALAVLYRILSILSPSVREFTLKSKLRLSSDDHIMTIFQRLTIGDCFLLHLLAKNVDELIFREIIQDLALSFTSTHLNNTTKYTDADTDKTKTSSNTRFRFAEKYLNKNSIQIQGPK
jgi:hypothetical protein